MVRIILLAVLCLTCVASWAQLKQPGYYITNDGQRTECTIRHFGFNSNPSEVQYMTGTSEFKTLKIEEVKEFGLTDGPVFYRYSVQMDRSPDIENRLSNNRAPEFKQETLFLRKVVAGKVTLYEYFDGIRRYFYTTDDAAVPQQLIYKRYMPVSKEGSQTNFAVKNETYKQQLANDLKCEAIEMRDIENLQYERKPLVSIVSRYNDCAAGIVRQQEKKESSTRFGFRPGIGFNSMTESGSGAPIFEDAMAPRIGFEVEINLKDPTKGWAIPIELAFDFFSTKSVPPGTSVSYRGITISGGVRKYFPIGGKSKLFANAHVMYALPTVTTAYEYVHSSGNIASLKIGSGINLRLGGGYQIGRFSLEAGYSLDRKMNLGNSSTTQLSYGGMAVIVGYYFK